MGPIANFESPAVNTAKIQSLKSIERIMKPVKAGVSKGVLEEVRKEPPYPKGEVCPFYFTFHLVPSVEPESPSMDKPSIPQDATVLSKKDFNRANFWVLELNKYFTAIGGLRAFRIKSLSATTFGAEWRVAISDTATLVTRLHTPLTIV